MPELPSGWISVPATEQWRVSGSIPVRPRDPLFWSVWILVQFALQIGIQVFAGEFGFLSAGIAFAVLILALLAGFLILAFRNQPPALNFDESAIRMGRRTLPFEQVTDAAFMTVPHRKGDSSYLLFGTGKLSSSILLRVRSELETEISDRERELVAEMLRRTKIALPPVKPDPYDPTGKFAWMDRPNNLTRDEAIEYVLHTPVTGQPVRSTPPKKSIWINGDTA